MTAACPRCGSTDPAVRRTYTDAESGQCFPCPNDEWHDRPAGADPVLAVTGRRIGATGIHLRPDGSECNYSVGPDSLICMKCGWPGIAEAPTGADDLPAQLEARTCPAGLPHTGDDPAADHGHTDCWLMRRAAARIRELEAKVERLQARGIENMQHQITEQQEAGDAAVRELDAIHQPMWAAPGPGYTLEPQEGKDPVGCQCCFPGDGSWPCESRMVADDLRKLP